MLDYASLFSAASELPVEDRRRLIDELAASLPKEHPAPDASEYEKLAYADAVAYLNEHREEVRQALLRRGGVTTHELLQKAAAALEQCSTPQ